MTVGDILDGAFKLLKANFGTVLAVVGILVVPIALITSFLQREALGPGLFAIFRDPLATQTTATDLGDVVSVGVAGLLGLLPLPFVAAAVSRVVAASYLGHRLGVGDALRAVARNWWALIASWVLVHLAETLATPFCILPGLLVMALFVVVAPAIAVEELGPIAGMKRSWNLVVRRLWPALGLALLSGLIATVISWTLSLPFGLAGAAFGERAWLLTAVGSIVSSLVELPLVAIVATLIYFDVRIRFEGFDLQVMAANTAVDAATPRV